MKFITYSYPDLDGFVWFVTHINKFVIMGQILCG